MGNMNEMKSGVYPEELVSTCGQSVNQILRKKADTCGCVAPDTEIRMADGSLKQIRNIRIGDYVVGRGNAIMMVMNCWIGPEREPMLEILVQGMKRALFVTKEHPIWVQEPDGTTKWKHAKDCKVSDMVLVSGYEEKYCAIKSIKEKEACDRVYNLDLRPLHGVVGQAGTMYCNGILTGDMQIQNGAKEG